jgi:hypothetical protein
MHSMKHESEKSIKPTETDPIGELDDECAPIVEFQIATLSTHELPDPVPIPEPESELPCTCERETKTVPTDDDAFMPGQYPLPIPGPCDVLQASITAFQLVRLSIREMPASVYPFPIPEPRSDFALT